MERPAEVLEHDGVRLRRWRRADLDASLRTVAESLEHLKPWMAWAVDGYGVAEAAAYLDRCEAEWESGAAYNYAVLGPDAALVGSCGLMARIGPGGLEIGYWLHPRYTGQGIITRAAAALTAEAFRIGADRVEITHDVANERSGAVPRRLGFTEVERRPAQEALAPAQTGTMVVWRATAPWPPRSR